MTRTMILRRALLPLVVVALALLAVPTTTAGRARCKAPKRAHVAKKDRNAIV